MFPSHDLGGLDKYKIAFRNGPHGSNTPVYINDAPVPRGEITIKSDMDTRAAVIPYSTHINTILDNPPVPPDFRIVPLSSNVTSLPPGAGLQQDVLQNAGNNTQQSVDQGIASNIQNLINNLRNNGYLG